MVQCLRHEIVGFLRKTIRSVVCGLSELRQYVEPPCSLEWLGSPGPLGCAIEHLPSSNGTQRVHGLPRRIIVIATLQSSSENIVDFGRRHRCNSTELELCLRCAFWKPSWERAVGGPGQYYQTPPDSLCHARYPSSSSSMTGSFLIR